MIPSILINIGQLRVGMYVQLDLAWMEHPFPVGSFRIASPEHIQTLRSLGLSELRYIPSKSDPEWALGPPAEGAAAVLSSAGAVAERDAPPSAVVSAGGAPDAHRIRWVEQHRALEACNQRFTDATRRYEEIVQSVQADPQAAHAQSDAMVSGCVSDVLSNSDSVIRLLSEGVGERNALHPINVMVVSLLLGKTLGCKSDELHDLGIAALLHDLGKVMLPPHLAQPFPSMTAPERLRYQAHVGESVALVERMGFPSAVLTAIAQHHEMADGSGFPLRLLGEDMSRAGHVLAIVNHYDRMCNPVHGGEAFTPHEALSIIFAQLKARFDPVVLGAFIRMMGVYPPGSIVQLVNDRYAIVASVNSTRPLRPKVIVHDPRVPKEEALLLDLETVPELGIRRSLRPSQLPREALDYLSPRLRICYFFERAVEPDSDTTDSHEAQP